jgi:hypothetical protein
VAAVGTRLPDDGPARVVHRFELETGRSSFVNAPFTGEANSGFTRQRPTEPPGDEDHQAHLHQRNEPDDRSSTDRRLRYVHAGHAMLRSRRGRTLPEPCHAVRRAPGRR